MRDQRGLRRTFPVAAARPCDMALVSVGNSSCRHDNFASKHPRRQERQVKSRHPAWQHLPATPDSVQVASREIKLHFPLEWLNDSPRAAARW